MPKRLVSRLAQPAPYASDSGAFAIAEPNLFWDQLLHLIEEGRVVPIVGQDLLTVRNGDRQTLLYPLLAERLADYLQVSSQDLPPDGELNAVACRFLEQGKPWEFLYSALKTVMPADDELSIPEPLLQLARIDKFELFVTTTFDSLLPRALEQARSTEVDVQAYAPDAIEDIPADRTGPTVYHLLGKLSAVPAYAFTQEDVLEFVHSLQSESRQPPLLFDELGQRSLLILGSSFGGWLARFFLRTTKRQRLLLARGRTDYLVDEEIQDDENLVLFLRHFASGTEIYRGGGALEFVAELHRRWRERHPDSDPADEAEDSAAAVPLAAAPSTVQAEAGAVFLSYASEDRAATVKIKEALEAVGVDVFFDKDDLRAGDDFEARLMRNIRECSLFIPVISRHTLTGRRRFFRLEWNQALEEARKVAPSETFIVPVVIDDTSPQESALPEKLATLHWQQLPDGDTPPAFVERVRDLFRRYHRGFA
ncbi:MAG: toll/interleukin-1 receptor domain-containing protein [Acidobacteriota bacterium]